MARRSAAVEVSSQVAVVVDSILALRILERSGGIRTTGIGEIHESVGWDLVVETVVADERPRRLLRIFRTRASGIG